jgi:hypothetical protein
MSSSLDSSYSLSEEELQETLEHAEIMHAVRLEVMEQQDASKDAQQMNHSIDCTSRSHIKDAQERKDESMLQEALEHAEIVQAVLIEVQEQENLEDKVSHSQDKSGAQKGLSTGDLIVLSNPKDAVDEHTTRWSAVDATCDLDHCIEPNEVEMRLNIPKLNDTKTVEESDGVSNNNIIQEQRCVQDLENEHEEELVDAMLSNMMHGEATEVVKTNEDIVAVNGEEDERSSHDVDNSEEYNDEVVTPLSISQMSSRIGIQPMQNISFSMDDLEASTMQKLLFSSDHSESKTGQGGPSATKDIDVPLDSSRQSMTALPSSCGNHTRTSQNDLSPQALTALDLSDTTKLSHNGAQTVSSKSSDSFAKHNDDESNTLDPLHNNAHDKEEFLPHSFSLAITDPEPPSPESNFSFNSRIESECLSPPLSAPRSYSSTGNQVITSDIPGSPETVNNGLYLSSFSVDALDSSFSGAFPSFHENVLLASYEEKLMRSRASPNVVQRKPSTSEVQSFIMSSAEDNTSNHFTPFEHWMDDVPPNNASHIESSHTATLSSAANTSLSNMQAIQSTRSNENVISPQSVGKDEGRDLSTSMSPIRSKYVMNPVLRDRVEVTRSDTEDSLRDLHMQSSLSTYLNENGNVDDRSCNGPTVYNIGDGVYVNMSLPDEKLEKKRFEPRHEQDTNDRQHFKKVGFISPRKNEHCDDKNNDSDSISSSDGLEASHPDSLSRDTETSFCFDRLESSIRATIQRAEYLLETYESRHPSFEDACTDRTRANDRLDGDDASRTSCPSSNRDMRGLDTYSTQSSELQCGNSNTPSEVGTLKDLILLETGANRKCAKEDAERSQDETYHTADFKCKKIPTDERINTLGEMSNIQMTNPSIVSAISRMKSSGSISGITTQAGKANPYFASPNSLQKVMRYSAPSPVKSYDVQAIDASTKHPSTRSDDVEAIATLTRPSFIKSDDMRAMHTLTRPRDRKVLYVDGSSKLGCTSSLDNDSLSVSGISVDCSEASRSVSRSVGSTKSSYRMKELIGKFERRDPETRVKDLINKFDRRENSYLVGVLEPVSRTERKNRNSLNNHNYSRQSSSRSGSSLSPLKPETRGQLGGRRRMENEARISSRESDIFSLPNEQRNTSYKSNPESLLSTRMPSVTEWTSNGITAVEPISATIVSQGTGICNHVRRSHPATERVVIDSMFTGRLLSPSKSGDDCTVSESRHN